MSMTLWFFLMLTPLVFVIKMFNLISLLIFIEMVNLCCILVFNNLMIYNFNYVIYLVIIFALDSLMLVTLLVLVLKFSSKDYMFVMY